MSSDDCQLMGGVDTHAHVFRRDLPLKADRRYSPDFDALPEDYLAHLDSAGLQYGVLVQPSFLGTDNSYMLDVLLAHADRLRGVAVVDVACPDDELERLALAGVVGIRLNLVGVPVPDLGGTLWQSLLIRVARRGWHVEIHRRAEDLPLIIPHILKAGCNVVVDHFGRPDSTAGAEDPGFFYLLSLATEGRVWVKLSALYRTWKPADASAKSHSIKLAELLLQSYGSQRLLWGSDWPHTEHRHLTEYAQSRQCLDTWVPQLEDRKRILIDSPIELFKF